MNQIPQSPPQRPKDPLGSLRKVREIAMGIVYLIVAAGMVVGVKTGYLDNFVPEMIYLLSGLATVYGIFRLYRVFKK